MIKNLYYILLGFMCLMLIRADSFQAGYSLFSGLTLFLFVHLSYALYKAYYHRGVNMLLLSGATIGAAAYYLYSYDIWFSYLFIAASLACFSLAYVESRVAYNWTGEKRAIYSVYYASNESHGQEKATFVNPAVAARYTFNDVVGMSEFKTRFLKAAQEVVDAGFAAKKLSAKKKRILARKGPQRSDSKARNGILLFGEPGNGKTFFAEALAGELDLPIITATFGDMVSMWVGETTQKAMQVFDDAVAQAPCVLFLDEIDAVIGKRDEVRNSDSESAKTTNAILTRLVDLRDKGVLIVAATNFIDKIDAAAKREGRFDYKIEVPMPDEPARKNLLELTLKKNLPAEIVVLPEAIGSAAKRWEGFSVSRLQAVGLEVASYAKDSGGIHTITFEHLMDALRRIQGSKGQRIGENIPKLDELSMNEAMARSLKGIANRMINIEETEALGGSVPSGLLFYGPPGTGKTFTAQSLAKTTGWAFMATSGQDILSRPERIDEIIAQAKDLRPCIVMIDEADDVFADRTTSPFTKSVTNKLLQVMDGAGGKAADILWIAATNHPDSMDSAALRGGRFTEKIEFGLPEGHVVATYISKWMASTKAKFHHDLTPEIIAQMIGEASLANVKEIMQAAVNSMISRKTSELDALVVMDDISAGIASVFG